MHCSFCSVCYLLVLLAFPGTRGQETSAEQTSLSTQKPPIEPADFPPEKAVSDEPADESVGLEPLEPADQTGNADGADSHDHGDADSADSHDHGHADGELHDWGYVSENTTETAADASYEQHVNTTAEPAGNFTAELPRNDTAPATNGTAEWRWCFVCDSASEAACGDPFNPEAARAAGLLQPCPVVPSMRTVCRKSWRVGLGDTRVSRSCAHDSEVRSCFMTAEAVEAAHVCHCYEDACNGAPDAPMQAIGLLIVSVAAVQAFY